MALSLDDILKTISRGGGPGARIAQGAVRPSGLAALQGAMAPVSRMGGMPGRAAGVVMPAGKLAGQGLMSAYTPPSGEGRGEGPGGFFGAALTGLTFPWAATISTMKETIDLLQGEGFSPSEWWNQATTQYGFGELIHDERKAVGWGLTAFGAATLNPLAMAGGAAVLADNIWADRIVGLGGDFIFDPLMHTRVLSGFARAGGWKGASKALSTFSKDARGIIQGVEKASTKNKAKVLAKAGQQLKARGFVKGTLTDKQAYTQAQVMVDAANAAHVEGRKGLSIMRARRSLDKSGEAGRQVADLLGLQPGMRAALPGTGGLGRLLGQDQLWNKIMRDPDWVTKRQIRQIPTFLKRDLPEADLARWVTQMRRAGKTGRESARLARADIDNTFRRLHSKDFAAAERLAESAKRVAGQAARASVEVPLPSFIKGAKGLGLGGRLIMQAADFPVRGALRVVSPTGKPSRMQKKLSTMFNPNDYIRGLLDSDDPYDVALGYRIEDIARFARGSAQFFAKSVDDRTSTLVKRAGGLGLPNEDVTRLIKAVDGSNSMSSNPGVEAGNLPFAVREIGPRIGLQSKGVIVDINTDSLWFRNLPERLQKMYLEEPRKFLALANDADAWLQTTDAFTAKAYGSKFAGTVQQAEARPYDGPRRLSERALRAVLGKRPTRKAMLAGDEIPYEMHGRSMPASVRDRMYVPGPEGRGSVVEFRDWSTGPDGALPVPLVDDAFGTLLDDSEKIVTRVVKGQEVPIRVLYDRGEPFHFLYPNEVGKSLDQQANEVMQRNFGINLFEDRFSILTDEWKKGMERDIKMQYFMQRLSHIFPVEDLTDLMDDIHAATIQMDLADKALLKERTRLRAARAEEARRRGWQEAREVDVATATAKQKEADTALSEIQKQISKLQNEMRAVEEFLSSVGVDTEKLGASLKTLQAKETQIARARTMGDWDDAVMAVEGAARRVESIATLVEEMKKTRQIVEGIIGQDVGGVPAGVKQMTALNAAKESLKAEEAGYAAAVARRDEYERIVREAAEEFQGRRAAIGKATKQANEAGERAASLKPLVTQRLTAEEVAARGPVRAAQEALDEANRVLQLRETGLGEARARAARLLAEMPSGAAERRARVVTDAPERVPDEAAWRARLDRRPSSNEVKTWRDAQRARLSVVYEVTKTGPVKAVKIRRNALSAWRTEWERRLTVARDELQEVVTGAEQRAAKAEAPPERPVVPREEFTPSREDIEAAEAAFGTAGEGGVAEARLGQGQQARVVRDRPELEDYVPPVDEAKAKQIVELDEKILRLASQEARMRKEIVDWDALTEGQRKYRRGRKTGVVDERRADRRLRLLQGELVKERNKVRRLKSLIRKQDIAAVEGEVAERAGYQYAPPRTRRAKQQYGRKMERPQYLLEDRRAVGAATRKVVKLNAKVKATYAKKKTAGDVDQYDDLIQAAERVLEARRQLDEADDLVKDYLRKGEGGIDVGEGGLRAPMAEGYPGRLQRATDQIVRAENDLTMAQEAVGGRAVTIVGTTDPRLPGTADLFAVKGTDGLVNFAGMRSTVMRVSQVSEQKRTWRFTGLDKKTGALLDLKPTPRGESLLPGGKSRAEMRALGWQFLDEFDPATGKRLEELGGERLWGEPWDVSQEAALARGQATVAARELGDLETKQSWASLRMRQGVPPEGELPGTTYTSREGLRENLLAALDEDTLSLEAQIEYVREQIKILLASFVGIANDDPTVKAMRALLSALSRRVVREPALSGSKRVDDYIYLIREFDKLETELLHEQFLRAPGDLETARTQLLEFNERVQGYADQAGLATVMTDLDAAVGGESLNVARRGLEASSEQIENLQANIKDMKVHADKQAKLVAERERLQLVMDKKSRAATFHSEAQVRALARIAELEIEVGHGTLTETAAYAAQAAMRELREVDSRIGRTLASLRQRGMDVGAGPELRQINDPLEEGAGALFRAQGKDIPKSMRGGAQDLGDALRQSVSRGGYVADIGTDTTLFQIRADMRKDAQIFLKEALSKNEWGPWVLLAGGKEGARLNTQVKAVIDAFAMVNDPAVFGKEGWFWGGWDKFQTYLKAAMIATPGFINRNIMGAYFNAIIDGVNPQFLLKSWSMTHRTAVRAIKEQVDFYTAAKMFRSEGAKDFDQYVSLLEAGVRGGGQAISSVELEIGLRDAGWRSLEMLVGRPGGTGKQWSVSWKPWSPRFWPYQSIRSANSFVEDVVRLGVGMDTMRWGGSVDDSIARIAKTQFDYDELTNWERQWAKRFFPFYTWTRKNVPYQLGQLARHPAKYNRILAIKRNMELGTKEEDIVPDYFLEPFGVRTPWSGSGGVIYSAPDIPFQDLFRYDPLRKGPKQAIQNVLSMTTPIIKAPLEAAMGKQIFSGVPFTGRYQLAPVFFTAPVLNQILQEAGFMQKAPNGDLKMRDHHIYAFSNMIPTIGLIRRMFPNEPKYQRNLLRNMISTLGGVSVSFNTDEAKHNWLTNLRYERQEERQNWKDMISQTR